MKKKWIRSKSQWWVDYVSVFLVGFVSMAIEIIGMRFVSPYMGTSTMVWSIFISVVLFSMSLGSMVGGKLADKYVPREVINKMIVGGILWLSGVLVLGDFILRFLSSIQLKHEYQSFLGIVLLFGVPFFLLSFMTPLVMRIYLKSLRATGSTVGKIQAISAWGNILGVLVPSFIFLNIFGTRLSLFLLILVLSLVLLGQIMISRMGKFRKFFSVVLLSVWLLSTCLLKDVGVDDGVLMDVDSYYSRIQLVRNVNDESKINLETGYLISQAVWTEDNSLIYKPGLVALDLIANELERTDEVLVIGGGGYAFPMMLAREGIKVNVVEIDEKITRVSNQMMKFSDNERISTVIMDGRVFVDMTNNTYDLIFLDAFSGDNMPFHLLTRQAFVSYHKLIPKGLLFVNYVGSFEEDGIEELAAIYRTIKSVFSNVEVYTQSIDLGRIQNLYLVASNQKIPEFGGIYYDKQKLATQSLIGIKAGILTDDNFPTRFTY